MKCGIGRVSESLEGQSKSGNEEDLRGAKATRNGDNGARDAHGES
jgi:hypothetical protein